MRADEIEAIIHHETPKQFWIDEIADLGARFANAHALIKGTDLTARRARRIEGQFRHASTEQGFETFALLHGAESLQGQYVPGGESLIYQPLMKFGSVIVGFAMHAEPGALPTKNKTRGGAVQLNFEFSDHLDFGHDPADQHLLYVALLASRDQQVAGAVRAIEIAVIDSKFDHFLYRRPIEKFLAAYPAVDPSGSTPVSADTEPLVKLKVRPKPFASTQDGPTKKGG